VSVRAAARSSPAAGDPQTPGRDAPGRSTRAWPPSLDRLPRCAAPSTPRRGPACRPSSGAPSAWPAARSTAALERQRSPPVSSATDSRRWRSTDSVVIPLTRCLPQPLTLQRPSGVETSPCTTHQPSTRTVTLPDRRAAPGSSASTASTRRRVSRPRIARVLAHATASHLLARRSGPARASRTPWLPCRRRTRSGSSRGGLDRERDKRGQVARVRRRNCL